MKKTAEYNETAARHIYTYHNTSGRINITQNEEMDVSVEHATKWLQSHDGEETLLILKKILEIAEGKDSYEIKLQNDGEWRMLFMTGDGANYKNRKESPEQLQATQRAKCRFEDLERKGYLGGTHNNIYVTLSGKEYYNQNAAKLNSSDSHGVI